MILARHFTAHVFLLRQNSTLPTTPTSRRIDIAVLRIKGMAALAVRLLGIKTPSSVDILFGRDWLQMGWIAAQRITAKMIELHSVWNWTDQEFIEDAVNILIPTCNADDAIEQSAAWNFCSCPRPTFCAVLRYTLFNPLKKH